MQTYLEQLIKNLVIFSLDINILMQNDASEKRLFDPTVLAIDYHWPI